MVNKFTLCLPPLRGSKEEGEVGAPKHSTHPAQAICIIQVHVMGIHPGFCRVCRGKHAQKCLWGWGLWPTFSRDQVGQYSQGSCHPIPRVWGPIVEGWARGVTPCLTCWISAS